MIPLIIKMNLIWGLFFLGYLFFLKRETFHQWNRIFLLAGLLIGLFLPLVELPGIADSLPFSVQLPSAGLSGFQGVGEPASDSRVSVGTGAILQAVYLVGVMLTAFRLFFGLVRIFRVYRSGSREPQGGIVLVRSEEVRVPFSFFHFLFWYGGSKPGIERDEVWMIRLHEETHIRQGHSLDALFLEILLVAFWWNPLVYVYRKALKDLHEYLADEAVAQYQPQRKASYGRLLLHQTCMQPDFQIANHFNQTQLKKRILMLTSKRSPYTAAWKYAAILPFTLIMSLLLCSGTALSAQSDEVFRVVEEMPRFPGCQEVKDQEEQQKCAFEKIVAFIGEQLRYPDQARKDGVEGMTVVQFVVEEDGAISDVEVVKKIGGGCDEEAVRIVSAMPDWIPGRQKGKPVKVKMNLPIMFKLDKKKMGE